MTKRTDKESLASYWRKRDFSVTGEPRGAQTQSNSAALSFVIQKHAASRLHYDFRLELDGVLVSWAVPKGPSFDPLDKRMAIHVEDHPLAYGAFEGTIPAKQYGAGTVIVWDRGIWEPLSDPNDGLSKGKLVFRLYGQKMAGLWELVKIAKGNEKQEPWLLFKKRDEFARSRAEYDVVSAMPDSVIVTPLTPASAPPSTHKTLPSPSTADKAFSKDQEKCISRALISIPGALESELPEKLSPQLATLAARAPSSRQWLYEIKFDGYRMMTRINQGKATLITRGGHDWSAKMPDLVSELERIGVETGWLDGEIIVLGKDGLPDFHALQEALNPQALNTPTNSSADVVYFVFDAPFLEGYDLRKVELHARRQLLKEFVDLTGSAHVRFSENFEADSASILNSACLMHMEGVIAKRKDSPYCSGRTESWLKLKCKQRQEFVVCGYTDRSDGSAHIGSLILGVHDERGQLMAAGSVGTGWTSAESSALKRKLEKLAVPTAPFLLGVPKPGRWSKRDGGLTNWVDPCIVAEVEFSGWTPGGKIRHASFVALRDDKSALQITRETLKELSPSKALSPKDSTHVAFKISHGERVIDPTTGLNKLDLFRYYDSVSQWILPHLKGRPCSLVRGPEGIAGELFFQKHAGNLEIRGIKELDPALWSAHPALLEIGSSQALTSAAQMNVIEFHTWNSLAKQIDKPDRMIFDLDPGDGTAWQHVQDAALLVRAFLSDLGLESWLKTSGGKGLHVVVPLKPQFDYETVKLFSKAIVEHLAKTIPGRLVAKSGPANRRGKLFVDYLRNGHGATTVAAFSARARPGLGVSMPVSWDDLLSLTSGAHWSIATARDHLSFLKADPWSDYWKKKQSLTTPMKALGFKADTIRN